LQALVADGQSETFDFVFIDADNRQASTVAIRAFNRDLKRDSRIEINMLPVADGITLVMKK